MTNQHHPQPDAPAEVPVPLPVSPVDGRIRRNFRDAVTAVDRSVAVETLDGVLVNVSPRTGKVIGRPRAITTRAFIVVAIMNFLDDRPGEVTSITDTFNTLPADLLRELEVPESIGPGRVQHHMVDHVWNRIAEACDSSQFHPGKRLKIVDGEPVSLYKAKQLDAKCLRPDLAEGDLVSQPTRRLSNRGTERDVPLTEAEQAERRGRLNTVVDGLLQATFPDGYTHSDWAVDWTDIESWGLTYRHDKATSADPDARWGRRRPKGNRIAGGRGSGPAEASEGDGATGDDAFEADKNERFFGYNAHIATTGASEAGIELAGSLRLTPANDNAAVAPTLVEMTDSILAAGMPVASMTVDLGYSMKTAETWLVPLSDRGVSVSFELESAKRGRHGSYRGAVLIGGVPHCPMTPEELTNQKVLAPSATRSDWEVYWDQRDSLDQYAFRPLGARTPDLIQRFQCPAYANKVRCPLQVQSLSLPADKDIPEIYDPPAEPPLCCTKPNMTLGRDIGLGYRQAHPYGSRSWLAAYASRTAVERYNSSLKYEQQILRGNIRVLGLARVTLMVAMACVATNIRHVRNWESCHSAASEIEADGHAESEAAA